MNKKLCFYEKDALTIVDSVQDGTDHGFYSGETLEEVRKRYPNAEIVPLDYAIEQINERKKEVDPLLCPVEITEEQYWDALEALPPMHMANGEGWTTFKMSELTFMDVTSGYVNKGGKYYNMNVLVKTKPEEMLAVCGL